MGKILVNPKYKKEYIRDLNSAMKKLSEIQYKTPYLSDLKLKKDKQTNKMISKYRFKLHEELLKLKNRIEED